jgi:Flp pilus assembly protein TadD
MKITCGMAAGFLVVAVIFGGSAAADDRQVPLFRDDDLRRYRQEVPAPVRAGEEPPATQAVKTKDVVFREHDRSVGAVAAYDAGGKAFSHGSGFVIEGNGAFVTSYHILSNAATVRVMLAGKMYEVEGVLFADRENDVVILKLSGTGLSAARLGDSRGIRPEDKAYLMDNLQGKGNRITEGLVSSVRDVGGRRMIQLALHFSGGSSGGPVFNAYGEVMGIAAMTVSDGTPVSFAVPVEAVKNRYSAGSVLPLREVLYRDRRQAADYWIAVADAHSAAGRNQEAKDAYQRALEADPDSAAAYNGLGLAYARLKQYAEAVEAYRMSLKLAPDTAWTLSNLGLAYIELRKYSEAIDALRHAVKAMPELSVAHFNLGIAYTNSERYREAAASYEEAIRLNPAMADAYYSLGLAYLYLHDRRSALRQHEKLKALDPAQAQKLWKKIRE